MHSTLWAWLGRREDEHRLQGNTIWKKKKNKTKQTKPILQAPTKQPTCTVKRQETGKRSKGRLIRPLLSSHLSCPYVSHVSSLNPPRALPGRQYGDQAVPQKDVNIQKVPEARVGPCCTTPSSCPALLQRLSSDLHGRTGLRAPRLLPTSHPQKKQRECPVPDTCTTILNYALPNLISQLPQRQLLHKTKHHC